MENNPDGEPRCASCEHLSRTHSPFSGDRHECRCKHPDAARCWRRAPAWKQRACPPAFICTTRNGATRPDADARPEWCPLMQEG